MLRLHHNKDPHLVFQLIQQTEIKVLLQIDATFERASSGMDLEQQDALFSQSCQEVYDSVPSIHVYRIHVLRIALLYPFPTTHHTLSSLLHSQPN